MLCHVDGEYACNQPHSHADNARTKGSLTAGILKSSRIGWVERMESGSSKSSAPTEVVESTKALLGTGMELFTVIVKMLSEYKEDRGLGGGWAEEGSSTAPESEKHRDGSNTRATKTTENQRHGVGPEQRSILTVHE